jgi:hypothetical protein
LFSHMLRHKPFFSLSMSTILLLTTPPSTLILTSRRR